VHNAEKLSQASGIFFITSLVFNQLRHIPVAIVSAFFYLIASFFYFCAYSTWFLASTLYPDHPGLSTEWYGFAEFKTQHIAAAFIGMIAVLCSLAAFMFPPVAILASWLFLFGNCIWLISELHKHEIMKNDARIQTLTHDKAYSKNRQQIYIQYASIIASIALVTALSTTLSLLFPSIALIVVTSAFVIGVCLSAVAAQKWVEYFVFYHPPDKPVESYQTMQRLGNNCQMQSKPAPKKRPVPIVNKMSNNHKEIHEKISDSNLTHPSENTYSR
jgi:hypothetical protein